MSNIDMSKLLSMISKMDKKDLEEGLSKANQILNSKDKNKLTEELNNLNQKRDEK